MIPAELNSSRGIYIFRMHLPSMQRISEGGKVGGHTFFKRLKSRAKSSHRLFTKIALIGSLRERKGKHLGLRYNIEASSKSFNIDILLDDLEDQVVAKDSKHSHEIFSYMMERQPILYVGMAAEQPLSSRIEQHISNSTDFSKKLLHSDLDWSDCVLDVVILNNCSKKEIRTWEKVLQASLRPIYSMH